MVFDRKYLVQYSVDAFLSYNGTLTDKRGSVARRGGELKLWNELPHKRLSYFTRFKTSLGKLLL